VQRWYEEISGRPAVQRGLKVLESQRRVLTDDRARENLFGATQYQRR
jgi:GST-like protein